MPSQIMPVGDDSSEWNIFGRAVPKSEAVFFSQIIIIYIVVITCIVNLSCANGNSNLWTALLSSSLGYILPNPSLKRQKTKVVTSSIPQPAE